MSSLKEGTHEMKDTVKTIKINYIEDGDDDGDDDDSKKDDVDCGGDDDDDNVVDDCDDEADDDGGNMRYSARCLLGFKVRTEEATCQCVASSLVSSSSSSAASVSS